MFARVLFAPAHNNQSPLSIQVGDPEEEGVFMGALNSKPHLEKVRRYMEYAVEDGGQGRKE